MHRHINKIKLLSLHIRSKCFFFSNCQGRSNVIIVIKLNNLDGIIVE